MGGPLARLAEKFVFLQFPIAAFFIIGNEFCERFSYYGLKAILPLYLHDYIELSEDASTSAVHAFVVIAYASALVGGYISDVYLGKFKTLTTFSLVYCLGGAALSITAIPGVTGNPPQWWGVAISLIIIGLGTGGIKACVAAFIGDQFTGDRAHLAENVFFYFYFAINLGSVVSTLATPLLRSYVSYPVAFGLPAVMLVLSTILLIAGKRFYVQVPPGESMAAATLGIIWAALKEMSLRDWMRLPVELFTENEWLDHAKETYGDRKVMEVKALIGVALIFTPLPIFWSLFDQHATRWVFQARQMDRNIFGFHVQPDQIPTLNPCLILILIPVFDMLIYPGLKRIFGIHLKPLQRMGIGMFITACSFVLSGMLQMFIDASQEHSIPVVLQVPQYVTLGAGEIMVSITGLQFAYQQAPATLKSVVMALWLMTTALGNGLVAVVAEANPLDSESMEFFFFAALMLAADGVFCIIARVYRDKASIVDGDGMEMVEMGEDTEASTAMLDQRSVLVVEEEEEDGHDDDDVDGGAGLLQEEAST